MIVTRRRWLVALAAVSAWLTAAPSVPVLWQPVELAGEWAPYRGARMETVDVNKPNGRVHRFTGTDPDYGGGRIVVTPRGGFGNRVRLSITYRVLEGGPVRVYAGPNTWAQTAAVLKSREWETAVVELGLPYDFHLVLHLAQFGSPAAFEVAKIKTLVRPPAGPLSEARLGPVDVAVDAYAPSDPALALELRGETTPVVLATADRSYHIRFAGNADSHARQGLGPLPAGTRLTLECRARVDAGQKATVGLRLNTDTLADAGTDGVEWGGVKVDSVLPRDGTPAWFAEGGAHGPVDLRLADVRVWAHLPDPLVPGTVKLPPGREPVTLDLKPPKSIFIATPWPGVRRLHCHLEYNSRWSFRSPTSHECEINDDKSELVLTWRFEDDPVAYELQMTVDQPSSLLMEARIRNGGTETAAAFTPGFCWQLAGAYSPNTLAYTLIPQQGSPFPMSAGTRFTPRPPLWPGIGWVQADHTGSPAYAERLAAGDAYQPPRQAQVRQTGDFPLLARRMPGRDAWIAWVWPNATRYFGNTQTPCMHMDPVIPPCPPRQARSVFGRMTFFEGSWDKLLAWARTERKRLAAMSGIAQ